MYIKISDIQIGGDSPYQLEPGISGLSAADIRTGDGLYTGVHGGYVSAQLYGHRELTFTGFYVASDCDTAHELRLELFSALKIDYLHPVFIKGFNDEFYFTEGYVTDIQSDFTHRSSGEFQITLLCPDPYFYGGGDGEDPDSIWNEITSRDTQTIENSGLVTTYPIFITPGGVVTDYGSSRQFNNETTNEYFYMSATVPSTKTLTVDMGKQTVTVSDGEEVASLLSSVSVGSSWWGLAPGTNIINSTPRLGVGFYDVVAGEYTGGVGEGTFTASLSYPEYPESLDIPSQYLALEYLTTSGVAVPTGVSPHLRATSLVEVEVKMSFSSDETQQRIFGIIGPNYHTLGVYLSAGLEIGYGDYIGGQDWTWTGVEYDTDVHTYYWGLEYSNEDRTEYTGTFSIDGGDTYSNTWSGTVSDDETGGYEIYLLGEAVYEDSTTLSDVHRFIDGTVYEMKIWETSASDGVRTLTHHFVPVLAGETIKYKVGYRGI